MKSTYKLFSCMYLIITSALVLQGQIKAADPGLREGESSTTVEPVDTGAKSQEEAQREAAEKAASQAQAIEADQPPAGSTERSDQEPLEGSGEKISTIPSLSTETAAKQGEEGKINVSDNSAWSSILNALSAVKSTIQSAISSFVRNVLGIRSVSPQVKAAALDLSTQVKELGADVTGFSEKIETASAGKPTSWRVIEAEFNILDGKVDHIVEGINKLLKLRDTANPADQKAIDMAKREASEVLDALLRRVYSSTGFVLSYRSLTPEEVQSEEEAWKNVNNLGERYNQLIKTLLKSS